MALIKCPECGKMISDQAEYCVGCGYSIPKASKRMEQKITINIKLLLFGVGVLVTAIIICSVVKGNNTQRKYSDYYESDPTYAIEPRYGKEGALAKADSYLNSQAYSYDRLVHMLEVEGFSTTEAEYAADYCGADWNEQAVKKAKSFLNSQAYSYDRLKHLLEVEGFSTSQAEYGVDHCGADWKEQAVKKASSYMSINDYSKSELIHLLEVEGFTHEQAKYGVDRNMN